MCHNLGMVTMGVHVDLVCLVCDDDDGVFGSVDKSKGEPAKT